MSEAKRSRTAEDVIRTNSAKSSQCASMTEPQLRRWGPGCYSLLSDTELVGGSWRVEAVLHLAGYGMSTKRANKVNTVPGASETSTLEAFTSCWDSSWGGQIVYVAKDEQDDVSVL